MNERTNEQKKLHESLIAISRMRWLAIEITTTKEDTENA